MHEGTALRAGEDGRIDFLLQFGAHEDESAPGTAKGFVGRRGDDVGVSEGRRIDARRHEPGVVGHVDHEESARFVGDAGHALEVDGERIGRGPRDEELRTVFEREPLERVVVDRFVFVESVGNGFEVLPGNVEGHPVREVAALGERKSHDRVAGLEKRKEDGGVRLRARMRLHVHGHLDARGLAKETLGALDRKAFHFVDIFATAVIALSGIAFGVLVRQHAPLSLHDGGRSVVFARDHFDVLFLTAAFPLDGSEHRRVAALKRVVSVKHGSPPFEKARFPSPSESGPTGLCLSSRARD